MEDIASRYDIILVRNNIVMGLISIILSRRLKKPFVFHYSHLIAETLILEAEKLGIRRYLTPKFYRGIVGRFLTGIVLKKADLVITTSESMRDSLEEEGFKSEKMIPIPSGADATIDVNKVDYNKIRVNYDLNNKSVLCYIGTMNRFRKLDFLLEIVEKLKDEYPIKLMMVGEGKSKDDLKYLKRIAKEKGLEDHVIFIGKIPWSKIPQYVLASDICISPFRPNRVLRTNSPVKLMEYMNLGKPVVGNIENIEQKQILTKSGGGICVKYNVKEFEEAIRYLLENPKTAKEMGMKGKAYIRKFRSYDIIADIVENNFKKLMI
jgi:glycosyltransferase involved in cell wall biosynthesis